MRTQRAAITALIFIASLLAVTTVPQAKDDDFKSVVKMIEQFYKVKHQGIPLLAKAGMKAATTIARIKGGTARRLAEAGSIKLAVFEDQSFNSREGLTAFRTTLNNALSNSWTPLIQTLSAPNNEQTYIFLRNIGDKYNVLVVTIEPSNATVVQVTVSARNLALLMRDPNEMGRSITEEATIVDP
jgi:hypothetical protein